ncbi:MAG: MmgE/PrpD family protein [Propionibacteriales bacterium]|nr:MmgE/PrpD family protein [Propionibacteriales bacterium]
MTTTQEFARGLNKLAQDRLPEPVIDEATRSVLNVIGTSIGAARYDEIDILVANALETGAQDRPSRVPGRPEYLDMMSAALAFGAAAHIDDFDDTHLATVVHPAASVLGAALPLVARSEVSGLGLVQAVALGVEAQLRVAVAMTPWHYDDGWHITGTVGPIGAAVTAGVLLGLQEAGLTSAIAIASSLSLGQRQGFGTMVKPFHPGKAAANGLLAAGLAAQGFTGSPTALEGPRGYFACLSPEVELEVLCAGLGEQWELLRNTYKPYPCGIVSHPAIEAAERLHDRMNGAEPTAVRVHCHPLVVELTGDPTPTTGLEARFSTIHGVAAGLVDGVVGLRQYDDARVIAPEPIAMRARTVLLPSEAVARAAAAVEVDLPDGRQLTERVSEARGSLERPLSDTELDAKVTALVEQTLPGRSQHIIDVVRSLPTADSTTGLLAAIVPED